MKSVRRFVVKKVIAALGIVKRAIKTKGFRIFNFIFVFLFIIQMFKIEVIETHVPIPTIKALIPITVGKNQIDKKRKTEPTK